MEDSEPKAIHLQFFNVKFPYNPLQLFKEFVTNKDNYDSECKFNSLNPLMTQETSNKFFGLVEIRSKQMKIGAYIRQQELYNVQSRVKVAATDISYRYIHEQFLLSWLPASIIDSNHSKSLT